MKRIVIPDGGRDGALIVTQNGVRSIPAFSPEILYLLRATANVVQASLAANEEKNSRSLARHSSTVANLAVQEIERAIGPLDADASVLYYDDDGGFTCGSTGKLPIPFPWPPHDMSSISELLAAGVVETDMIDFIEKGRAKGIALKELFHNPTKVAASLGVALSKKTVEDLSHLDPATPIQITEPIDREILGFFHKVVDDGRFVSTWFDKPYETANTLDYKLSDKAIERLISRGSLASHGLGGGGPVADFGVSVVTISVADAVIVYIVATKSRPINEVVVDFSAVAKI